MRLWLNIIFPKTPKNQSGSRYSYIFFYYLSLVHSQSGFAELRNQVSLNLMIFSYGFIAWQSISSIIAGILEQYADLAGENTTEAIKVDIEN